MADESRKPDAATYPFGWTPLGWEDNAASLPAPDARYEFFLKLLGAQPHFRPGPVIFVTTSPNDSQLFPTGHRLEKRPRYDWVEQNNGCSYGYLKAEATVDDHLDPAVKRARDARAALVVEMARAKAEAEAAKAEAEAPPE